MNKLKVLALFLFIFGLNACQNKKDDSAALNDRDTITNRNDNGQLADNYHNNTMNDDKITYEEKVDYKYSERDKWKNNLESSIDKLDKRIDQLEDKAADAKGDLKKSYNKQIDKLKVKRKNLELKLDKYESTDENGWDAFKKDVKRAWDDVEESVNKVVDDVNVSTDKK